MDDSGGERQVLLRTLPPPATVEPNPNEVHIGSSLAALVIQLHRHTRMRTGYTACRDSMDPLGHPLGTNCGRTPWRCLGDVSQSRRRKPLKFPSRPRYVHISLVLVSPARLSARDAAHVAPTPAGCSYLITAVITPSSRRVLVHRFTSGCVLPSRRPPVRHPSLPLSLTSSTHIPHDSGTYRDVEWTLLAAIAALHLSRKRAVMPRICVR
ncbi:hypothetical protein K466DRAFT_393711 [Polyporus arcularius HHB13444]|uniref:Uncharacterized protein n=1 Tax=Polyporus arcularius HHB13444 TaxID=1314778 RepID=A0A5C3NTL9_9APHY|nr:hypothetical protein K466DRAFT_393711 [Polyporus arcularius HHB13444]